MLARFRLIISIIFSYIGSYSFGQSADTVSMLAHVSPANGDQIGVALEGSKIFTDQHFVFAKLPAMFREAGYLMGSMTAGSRVVPVTAGSLFVVTPVTGEKGSQEQQLLKQGFIRVNHPSFTLFEGQEADIAIFKKQITYHQFRLEAVQYKGWAVPFFEAKTLPSIEEPARVTWLPDDSYAKHTRQWQGCPAIAKTGKRLWAAWFSGGVREPDGGNYGILSYQDNDAPWVDPAMVITHPNSIVRVMDPQLWKAPNGSLWVFWVQNTGETGFDGIWGTWAIRIDNPEDERPTWTPPRRLCDGLTRNKPIILSSGEWLLPSYDWINHQSAVYISNDQGESWALQGGPFNKPISNFYEHMCVQLTNGNIWMLQRNVQESLSTNKGKTWTTLKEVEGFTSANSRLYIGRLQSGNLLIVYNNDPNQKKRKNLTARLSLDDGKTWPYSLVLDERDDVSYPDVIQDDDGVIYVIYDRSRRGEKEILLTTFTEDDIVASRFVSTPAKPKNVISKVN